MYKVVISGRGTHSFYDASAEKKFGSCKVKVGKKEYMHKHGEMQKIDAETGLVGKIKSIKEAIGKKRWMIELEESN